MVHGDESHSTLRFACRAKRVVNNAMVNEVLSDAAVLKRQAKEIEELRRVLAANGGGWVAPRTALSLRECISGLMLHFNRPSALSSPRKIFTLVAATGFTENGPQLVAFASSCLCSFQDWP